MERFTALMQGALTLILVGAFIALLVYKGAESADALKEFVGLAVTFWLMRQRTEPPVHAPLPPPQAINPPASPPNQPKDPLNG